MMNMMDAFLALKDVSDDAVAGMLKEDLNEGKTIGISGAMSEEDYKEAVNYLTDDNAQTKIDVIDVDADSLNHIKNKEDYIGQGILQCGRCRANHFIDLDKLVPDEDDPNLYNVETECPHCHSAGAGFELIGQVGKVVPDEEEAEQETEIENDDKVNDEESKFDNDIVDDEEETEDEETADDENVESVDIDTLEAEAEDDGMETELEDDTADEESTLGDEIKKDDLETPYADDTDEEEVEKKEQKEETEEDTDKKEEKEKKESLNECDPRITNNKDEDDEIVEESLNPTETDVIKNSFPKGTKIRIISMKDEPKYNGAVGEVTSVDDIGQIHGTWGGCAIVPEVDTFEIIRQDMSQAVATKEGWESSSFKSDYRLVRWDGSIENFDGSRREAIEFAEDYGYAGVINRYGDLIWGCMGNTEESKKRKTFLGIKLDEAIGDNAKEAWMMNRVISSLNAEEAYYSDWLRLWPDGETLEECRYDFEDTESFEELRELFLEVYEKYQGDGLYDAEEDVEAYAHRIDSLLGLRPIDNIRPFNEIKENIEPWTIGVIESANDVFGYMVDPESIDTVIVEGINEGNDNEVIFRGCYDELPEEFKTNKFDAFDVEDGYFVCNVDNEGKGPTVNDVLKTFGDSDKISIWDTNSCEELACGNKQDIRQAFGDKKIVSFETPRVIRFCFKKDCIDPKCCCARPDDVTCDDAELDNLFKQICAENKLSRGNAIYPNTNEYWIKESLQTKDDLEYVFKTYVAKTSLVEQFKKVTGYKDELDLITEKYKTDKRVEKILTESINESSDSEMMQAHEQAVKLIQEKGLYAVIYGYFGKEGKYFKINPLIEAATPESVTKGTEYVMKTYHPAGSICVAYSEGPSGKSAEKTEKPEQTAEPEQKEAENKSAEVSDNLFELTKQLGIKTLGELKDRLKDTGIHKHDDIIKYLQDEVKKLNESVDFNKVSANVKEAVFDARVAILVYDHFYKEILNNPEVAKKLQLDPAKVKDDYEKAIAFLDTLPQEEIGEIKEIDLKEENYDTIDEGMGTDDIYFRDFDGLILEEADLLIDDPTTGDIKVDRGIFDSFEKDATIDILFIDSKNPDLYDTYQMIDEDEEGIFMQFIGEGGRIIDFNEQVEESLNEDTIKTQNGKWINKGKEGTHGEFDTKKEADAQRKAMFATGYKECVESFKSRKDLGEAIVKCDNNKVVYKVRRSLTEGFRYDLVKIVEDAENRDEFAEIIAELNKRLADKEEAYDAMSSRHDPDDRHDIAELENDIQKIKDLLNDIRNGRSSIEEVKDRMTRLEEKLSAEYDAPSDIVESADAETLNAEESAEVAVALQNILDILETPLEEGINESENALQKMKRLARIKEDVEDPEVITPAEENFTLETVKKISKVAKDISTAVEETYGVKVDPIAVLGDILRDLELINGTVSVDDVDDATAEMFNDYTETQKFIDALLSADTGETIETTKEEQLKDAINSLDSDAFSAENIKATIASDEFKRALQAGQVPFAELKQLPFNEQDFEDSVNEYFDDNYEDDVVYYNDDYKVADDKIMIEGYVQCQDKKAPITFTLTKSDKLDESTGATQYNVINNLSEEVLTLSF